MDWGRSYSATWRVYRVNRYTWADGERITNIDSIDITRTADGDLLESGGLTATGDLSADYYRIVMTAVQGGEVARVDVATLLFDATGGTHDHGVTEKEMDGFSVLWPASRTTIVSGEYAPAGVDGAQYAKALLEESINAPVVAEGSFVLNEHIVHEIGSSVLDAVWAVLEAGGFVLQIDGRGVVHIVQKPSTPALILDSRNAKLLSPGITQSADTSDIPNRYIVIVDNNKTIAVNEDPNSTISTVSRGYYIDEVDESPTPVNGETMSAYAERKLIEASVLREEHEYGREYAPDVYLYDIVRATLRELNGDLRVDSQSITCGTGVTITEKAYKEVALYAR